MLELADMRIFRAVAETGIAITLMYGRVFDYDDDE